jgi:glycosyltransferase involved in cell wall biosynthesis
MLSGVAFELSRRGLPVAGLAGQPAYRRGKERLPRVVENEGVRVRRVWSTRLDKNVPPGARPQCRTFATSIFAACLFGRRPAAVVAVTNPPLLPWVAEAVRTLRRVPSILVIHDVYPQIATALGKMRTGSAAERLWRLLNRRAYRGAWRIIVLGDRMAEIIRAELPPDQREKVLVIPNWADGEAIRPMPRQGHPLLAEWGLDEGFVLQYSGNIGLFHEIETIARAAELLRDHRDIRFLFVGDGGRLPWLKSFVAEKKLENVVFQPFQPREKLPLSLTACDAGLAALKAEASGLCVPSKLYGILAAGRPVLAVAAEESETVQTVRRGQCGLIAAPGDAQGLAAAAQRLRDNPQEAERLGQAARELFEREFTLEIAASAHEILFRELLKSFSSSS